MARTVILAWVIGVLSIVMIGVGIAGVLDLYRQTERAPLKKILWRGDLHDMWRRCRVGRGAAVAFRAGSYSDARPLSEVSAAPSE